MITNSEIKRVAGQVFAYGSQYETPFYNRHISRKELIDKSKNFVNGQVFIISEPLGTGKTFFMDALGKQIGLLEKQSPVFARNINPKILAASQKEPILFVDEADIKTPWKTLNSALDTLAEHLEKSGQKTILIGDYSLRQPKLTDCFKHQDMMETFEPLDREFLKGVLDSRLEKYLKKKDDIIDGDLMALILPESMTPAASFRTLLTMFSQLVRLLPSNSDPCRLTLDLARDWVDQEFPELNTQRQADFLNLFLDYLSERHPNGEGLGGGMYTAQLLEIASEISPKFESTEEFETEIIEPFTRLELLISMGIPYLNEKETFIRRPEPFLPSIKLLLLS